MKHRPWENKEEGPGAKHDGAAFGIPKQNRWAEEEGADPEHDRSTFQRLMENTDSAEQAAARNLSVLTSAVRSSSGTAWFNQLMGPTSAEKVAHHAGDASSCGYKSSMHPFVTS